MTCFDPLYAWRHAAACVALAAAGPAAATEPAMPARDPTLAPVFTAAATPGAPAAPAASAAAAPARPRHILVVVDGRHYVMDGARRRGVGDLLGNARIERIDDAGVWLREGGVLRQSALYGNVAKRPAGDGETAAARADGGGRPGHATLARSSDQKPNR